MDRDEPTRKHRRSESDAPRCKFTHMLTAAPQRENPRSDTELPNSILEQTDNAAPNFVCPKMDRLDPSLENLRNANELPRWVKSITANPAPIRAKPLSARQLLSHKASIENKNGSMRRQADIGCDTPGHEGLRGATSDSGDSTSNRSIKTFE